MYGLHSCHCIVQSELAGVKVGSTLCPPECHRQNLAVADHCANPGSWGDDMGADRDAKSELGVSELGVWCKFSFPKTRIMESCSSATSGFLWSFLLEDL